MSTNSYPGVKKSDPAVYVHEEFPTCKYNQRTGERKVFADPDEFEQYCEETKSNPKEWFDNPDYKPERPRVPGKSPEQVLEEENAQLRAELDALRASASAAANTKAAELAALRAKVVAAAPAPVVVEEVKSDIDAPAVDADAAAAADAAANAEAAAAAKKAADVAAKNKFVNQRGPAARS